MATRKTPARKPAPNVAPKPATRSRTATPRAKAAPAKAAPAARIPTESSEAPARAAPPAGVAPTAPAPVAKPAADKAAAKPKKSGKKDQKSKGDDQPGGKNKLVRDSFTMPATDYALIGALKARTLASGTSVKKSELLRAGLNALAAMSPAQLIGLIASMPHVKTGRPGKKK